MLFTFSGSIEERHRFFWINHYRFYLNIDPVFNVPHRRDRRDEGLPSREFDWFW
mgnify:CR=1 FL=1